MGGESVFKFFTLSYWAHFLMHSEINASYLRLTVNPNNSENSWIEKLLCEIGNLYPAPTPDVTLILPKLKERIRLPYTIESFLPFFLTRSIQYKDAFRYINPSTQQAEYHRSGVIDGMELVFQEEHVSEHNGENYTHRNSIFLIKDFEGPNRMDIAPEWMSLCDCYASRHSIENFFQNVSFNEVFHAKDKLNKELRGEIDMLEMLNVIIDSIKALFSKLQKKSNFSLVFKESVLEVEFFWRVFYYFSKDFSIFELFVEKYTRADERFFEISQLSIASNKWGQLGKSPTEEEKINAVKRFEELLQVNLSVRERFFGLKELLYDLLELTREDVDQKSILGAENEMDVFTCLLLESLEYFKKPLPIIALTQYFFRIFLGDKIGNVNVVQNLKLAIEKIDSGASEVMEDYSVIELNRNNDYNEYSNPYNF
ncbi:hypothetical protein PCE1_000223 [Barthelona sp. PCE]